MNLDTLFPAPDRRWEVPGSVVWWEKTVGASEEGEREGLPLISLYLPVTVPPQTLQAPVPSSVVEPLQVVQFGAKAFPLLPAFPQ